MHTDRAQRTAGVYRGVGFIRRELSRGEILPMDANCRLSHRGRVGVWAGFEGGELWRRAGLAISDISWASCVYCAASLPSKMHYLSNEFK